MSTRRIAFAAIAALAVVVLAGCSKSPASGAESSPSAAETPASATDYGTATQAGPTKIKLDIAVGAKGEAIYGDPTRGKSVFSQCLSCHAKEAGVSGVGPTLHGIIGRHSGTVPGFKYSAANKASGLVWTEQELYVYLENPQKVVPGTYMTYTGVKDPQKRADLIAYLRDSTQ